jgi:hypothetical protein
LVKGLAGFDLAKACLFVAPAPARSSSSLALRTRLNGTSGVDRGRCGTLRHDPELNRQVCTATTIYDSDASSLDSARFDEIVLGAVATLF